MITIKMRFCGSYGRGMKNQKRGFLGNGSADFDEKNTYLGHKLFIALCNKTLPLKKSDFS